MKFFYIFTICVFTAFNSVAVDDLGLDPDEETVEAQSDNSKSSNTVQKATKKKSANIKKRHSSKHASHKKRARVKKRKKKAKR